MQGAASMQRQATRSIALQQQRLSVPHHAAVRRRHTATSGRVDVGVEIGCTAVDSSSPTSYQEQQEGRVRPVRGPEQIKQVAWLRAEAYYEEERSRFVESFKKKFASGEADSLEQRTAPHPPHGKPLVECLVVCDDASKDEDSDEGASTSGSPNVLGCIDIRVPFSASGRHPVGVPDGDEAAAYILNVVVHEESRGQGIGKMLMKAAMKRAVDKWASERLYTHVAADNEVALRLYTGCGFREYSVDAQALEGGLTLGKLLLLRATAEDAAQL